VSRFRRLTIAIVASVPGAGCIDLGPKVCSLDEVVATAFMVDVRDAITAQPLAAGVAFEIGITDYAGRWVFSPASIITAPTAGQPYYHVGGVAGTFALKVSAPGYATQTRSPIVVHAGPARDECHPVLRAETLVVGLFAETAGAYLRRSEY
jgi:hypothetical protein